MTIASNRPSGEGAGSWSERRLAVLYETARSLAESATLDQAIPQILNAVCGALGWEYGALWDVDAKAGVLRCTATWSSIPLSFEFFATGSRDRTFIPGEGLPGRVWKSGAPAWIPDIRTDDNFPRAAAASRDGLHSALGFPLIADGATVGVMEFFSREIQQPDETLLDMLGAIGGQIGTFMKRRSAQDDLDRFFTLSLDMLCVATLEGYFIRVNPQWTAVTGFTVDELRSRPYMEYVHPDDRPATLQAGARLAAGDAVVSFENRYQCKDGSYRWLVWMAAPYLGQRLIYATARDVTDRRKAEDELRRYASAMVAARETQEENAERLRQLVAELDAARRKAENATLAKGEFLANMSHEIRTPMNAILGMTQLLAKSNLGDDQRDLVNAAGSAAESLLGLINDILDFSKIEARRLELESITFDLRETLADALRLVVQRAHEKGVVLASNVDPGVPAAIVGDPARLRQVLLNLTGNAIKFTDRGEVVVSVEVMDLDRGERVEPGEVRLHFAVRDTGIGVPADKQWQIFGPFVQADGSTTRKYGGTGLGLTISAELVELMHGRIWIDSALGQGSTFHFSAVFGLGTPGAAAVAPGRESGAATPAAVQTTPRRPLRILLAEDNVINQKVVVGMLASGGHQVTTVDNGRDAVAAVQSQTFDLVLMDIQMPLMGGLEATAAIRDSERAGDRRIPIIAMTAHAMTGDREQCLAAGMDGYLPKPLRITDLFGAIATATGQTARPAVADQAAILDEQQLLAQDFGGDAVLLGEVIDAFLADAPDAMRELARAIEAGDAALLTQRAHKWKGTIGVFTTGPAFSAVLEVEMAARRADLGAARAALARLERAVEALSARLREIRG